MKKIILILVTFFIFPSAWAEQIACPLEKSCKDNQCTLNGNVADVHMNFVGERTTQYSTYYNGQQGKLIQHTNPNYYEIAGSMSSGGYTVTIPTRDFPYGSYIKDVIGFNTVIVEGNVNYIEARAGNSVNIGIEVWNRETNETTTTNCEIGFYKADKPVASSEKKYNWDKK